MRAPGGHSWETLAGALTQAATIALDDTPLTPHVPSCSSDFAKGIVQRVVFLNFHS